MLINYCLLLKEIHYDLYFRSIESPRNVNANMCVRTAKAEKRMKERLNQEVQFKKNISKNRSFKFLYIKYTIYIFKGNCIR